MPINEIIKSVLNEILVQHTGQSRDRIDVDTDRDRFMTAEEAKDYGIIDEVIVSRNGRQATTVTEAEDTTEA